MQLKLSLQEAQSPFLVRVISYNIRYATGNPDPNEHFWSDRFPRLARQLRHETRPFSPLEESSTSGYSNSGGELRTSFIGLQEVLHNQLVDIMNTLNSTSAKHDNEDEESNEKWAYIGVARDDGKKAGEYGPILYQPGVVKLLHWETIWLSTTPTRPTFGWDAACKRILTFGVFEPVSALNMDKPKKLLVCNTHLDHQGSVSRRKSVDVILQTIKRINKDWSPDAVILTGDFNSTTSQEAYRGMVEANLLKDARECVSDEERYGNEITYTGFGRGEERKKIDYIWVGMADRVSLSKIRRNEKVKPAKDEDISDENVEVLGFACIPNVFDDGVYISDHRAVIADIVIR